MFWRLFGGVSKVFDVGDSKMWIGECVGYSADGCGVARKEMAARRWVACSHLSVCRVSLCVEKSNCLC